ncbi:MAG: histidinol-phosphatase HisJ family protein [Ruminococcaceae bacterium]|nr:histidinol-phosphatase HisJ family protein [Oscillospiraceae bacterium]
MICDLHTHTHFSFDGAHEATADALCRRALEAGISHLAITDHCDINGEVEGIYTPYAADAAWEEMTAAKEKYRGRLHLSLGIELGNAHQYPIEAAAVLAKHPYEFVIGSLHNLKDVPDFCMLRYEMMTDAHIHRLFNRMLDETLDMISFDGLHTLGHLTYMHRYITLAKKPFNFKPHYDQIMAIYEKLIRLDMALELNVSTLWKGLGVSMPTLELLKLYKDMGGKLITVGSDAHSPENVGKCIRKGYALLQTAGFSEVMVVENGQRIMASIL